jgi:hypothetical protein
MAEIRIVGPDGSSFTFPAGTPPETIEAAMRSHFGAQQQPPARDEDPVRAQVRQELDELRARGAPVGDGRARQFLQGATLGFADEALAALSTPLEMISRRTFNPAEAYNFAKAREDILLEGAREDGGLLGIGAEALGGVVTGSGIARAVQQAAPATSAVGRITQSLLRQPGPQAGAGARIAGAAKDGALFGAVTGAGEGDGVEGRSTGALIGGGLGGVLGAGVTGGIAAGGAVGRNALGFISAARDPSGHAERQVVRMAMESGRTPQEIADALARANANGTPLVLGDVMGRSGQQGLHVVARNPGPGRDAAVDFLEARQAGQAGRVSAAISDAFDAPDTAAARAAALTQSRDSTADVAYEAARQAARPVNLTPTLDVIDGLLRRDPILGDTALSMGPMGARLRAVRDRMQRGGEQLIDFDEVLNLKTDLFRQMQRNPDAARDLRSVYSALDNALETASDAYRAANDGFRTASGVIAAVDEGAAMARPRARAADTTATFAQMTPEQQAAARAGYADPIIARVEGSASTTNVTRPLTADKYAREFPVMAAPGRAPLLAERLADENLAFRTTARALGGSSTTENLADNAAAGVSPEIINNLLSGNLGAAARNLTVRSVDGLSGNTAPVRQRMAELLLSMNDPNVTAMISQQVNEQTRRRMIADALVRGALGGTSTGSAAAIGTGPR